jgi:hypothetical protein
MTDTIITKREITLLSAPTLVKAIKNLEHCVPGWWWSISQMRKRIRVTVAPQRSAPDAKHVALAKTKLGDEGFHYSDHFAAPEQEESFLEFIAMICRMSKEHSDHLVPSEDDIAQVDLKVSFRRQSEDDLKRLEDSYTKFLKEVATIEEGGNELREVYLGSCDLSIDCSLRGLRDDVSEFDISVDLIDDAILAESLDEAVIEIKQDIVTHRMAMPTKTEDQMFATFCKNGGLP